MSKVRNLATCIGVIAAVFLSQASANAQWVGDAQQSAQPVANQAPAGTPPHVKQWFASYDQIRHKAQMTPQERQKADNLLSKGLSILVPGDEKVSTMNLLQSLVTKYTTAVDQMKKLPLYPETDKLHRGYYQYFTDAKNLFSDYLKVQNNLFITDAATGKPLAGTLLTRKQNLEALELSDKQLDGELRQTYGIAPYPW